MQTNSEQAKSLRVIGPGRAGTSLARALAEAGWRVLPPLGRGDDVRAAACDVDGEGVDLLVIATPDGTIGAVAAAVEPADRPGVAHLAGSVGLDVLLPHRRRAVIHPLVALPDADTGARALRGGAWFAVTGDEFARRVVHDLGGRSLQVADGDRVAYHAAACIASNHLVALLGQAERVAASAGVPLDAHLDLVRATVDNVATLGPAAAPARPRTRCRLGGGLRRPPRALAVDRGDVPGSDGHDRLGRLRLGGPRGRATPHPLRRRGHGRDEAPRSGRAVPRLLGREGLPATRRDPAPGARPLVPRRGRGCRDRA